jgi:hypothetical protein
VRLLRIEDSGKGMPELIVGGVDLMDGTPIYDIKPYIPYADCITDASAGFAADPGEHIPVEIPPDVEEKIPEEKRSVLRQVLELDPRPRYLGMGEREYGFEFGGLAIRFIADKGILRVLSAEEKEKEKSG